MADVHRPTHQQQQPITESLKSLMPDKGPSASQVIAVATLVPVGGILLGLSGVTLVGTIIGLCLATPVFLIFSPILVPAALAIGLSVLGFLSSGAFGVTGLTALSWLVDALRGTRRIVPERLEQAKHRVQEAAGQAGQRIKDVGQTVQSQAGSEGPARS